MLNRVVIGAPRGSFPGGLSLEDPLEPAAMNTGLVYSCPIGPGDCEGVTGNRDLYIGSGILNDTTNHVLSISLGSDNFFPPALSEGRLFDQARKSMIHEQTCLLKCPGWGFEIGHPYIGRLCETKHIVSSCLRMHQSKANPQVEWV